MSTPNYRSGKTGKYTKPEIAAADAERHVAEPRGKRKKKTATNFDAKLREAAEGVKMQTESDYELRVVETEPAEFWRDLRPLERGEALWRLWGENVTEAHYFALKGEMPTPVFAIGKGSDGIVRMITTYKVET